MNSLLKLGGNKTQHAQRLVALFEDSLVTFESLLHVCCTSEGPAPKTPVFDRHQCGDFFIRSKSEDFSKFKARVSMKTHYAVALVVAGFGFGILADQSIAQISSPPAYVVTLFDSGLKSASDTDYPSLNPATFQPYGGHYIIHFGRTVSFDGSPRIDLWSSRSTA